MPVIIISMGLLAFAQQNWSLSLWVDGGVLHQLMIGMDTLATDGFDVKIDRAAPPVPPVGFFAYFPCNDVKYPYIPALWYDIRSPADSAMWKMLLRNTEAPVIVEWNPDSLPAGYISIEGKSLLDLGTQYKVPMGDTVIVLRYSKKANIKNVFNPLAIRFSLSAPANVQITIADRNGNVVDVINLGLLSAGEHSVVWSAKTSAGIYFYSVEANGVQIASGKIVAIGKK